VNCRDFEEKLPQLLREPVPADLREGAAIHTASCLRCRRLLALARGEAGPMDDAAARGLTRAVLAETSGAVCAKIEERLVDWVDLTPWTKRQPGIEDELVGQHLDHCRQCTELVQTLRMLREELPEMAEVEPDTRFVVDVLEQTSRLKQGKRSWSSLADDWWTHLIRRPRIALEAAYVAALLFFLLLGSPAPFIRDISMRSVGLARTELAAGMASLEQRELPLVGALGVVGDSLRREAGRPVREKTDGWVPRISNTGKRLGQTLTLAGQYGKAMGDGVLHGDMVTAWGAAQEWKQKMRTCWGKSSPGPADGNNTEPPADSLRIDARSQPETNP
jgi:hypothetical protein